MLGARGNIPGRAETALDPPPSKLGTNSSSFDHGNIEVVKTHAIVCVLQ
jgi:hypothetical protein